MKKLIATIAVVVGLVGCGTEGGFQPPCERYSTVYHVVLDRSIANELIVISRECVGPNDEYSVCFWEYRPNNADATSWYFPAEPNSCM